MNAACEELAEFDEPTIQIDLSDRILEEVLALRTVVTNLSKQVELICLEQRRQGKATGELLELCQARARVCGAISASTIATQPYEDKDGSQ